LKLICNSSSEDNFDEQLESSRLEKFQKMLAVLALAAVPTGEEANNPVFWAQFDDVSAWQVHFRALVVDANDLKIQGEGP
jgi:hypothetical protein